MILYLIIILLLVLLVYFIGLYRHHKRKHRHYMRMWRKSQFTNGALVEQLNMYDKKLDEAIQKLENRI